MDPFIQGLVQQIDDRIAAIEQDELAKLRAARFDLTGEKQVDESEGARQQLQAVREALAAMRQERDTAQRLLEEERRKVVVRQEAVDRVASERNALRAELDALTAASKAESDKTPSPPDETPEKKPEKPHLTAVDSQPRRTSPDLAVETVRDVILRKHRDGEWFMIGSVAGEFPEFHDATVKRRMMVLADKGMLEQNGKTGKAGRWRFIRPKGEVTQRPKAPSPEQMAGVGSGAAKRGIVVPHTRMVGRSGKPGMDKKRAAQGKRVKRGRVGS